MKQVAADDWDFYGLPYESASASNADGKCVTAGETAPTKGATQKAESLRGQLSAPDGAVKG
jgi:hypothetical protein